MSGYPLLFHRPVVYRSTPADVYSTTSQQHQLETTMYFNNVKNLDDLKTTFRKLAMQYHPDKNPGREDEVTAIMQQINAEYEIAMKRILRSGGKSEAQVDEEMEIDAQIREVIQKIANIDGIVIELVGTWLWVTGNTFAVRHQLKAAGLLYASKKQCWFYRSEENKSRYNRRSLDLEDIRSLHGTKTVTPDRRAVLSA
jgi:hypothetical protein